MLTPPPPSFSLCIQAFLIQPCEIFAHVTLTYVGPALSCTTDYCLSI